MPVVTLPEPVAGVGERRFTSALNGSCAARFVVVCITRPASISAMLGARGMRSDGDAVTAMPPLAARP